MLERIKRIVVAVLAFAILDYVWLGLLMRTFYRSRIGALFSATSPMQQGIQWWPVFIVYGLLAVGMVLFVIPRASRFLYSSFMWGAGFGLVVYGIYNATNLAILPGWSLTLALVDMAWGIVLCGSVSVVTMAFSSRTP